MTSTADGSCSRMAGVSPSASSRSSYSMVSTAFAFGSGTRLSRASTIRPSVPSEPTTSRARLNGSPAAARAGVKASRL